MENCGQVRLEAGRIWELRGGVVRREGEMIGGKMSEKNFVVPLRSENVESAGKFARLEMEKEGRKA